MDSTEEGIMADIKDEESDDRRKSPELYSPKPLKRKRIRYPEEESEVEKSTKQFRRERQRFGNSNTEYKQEMTYQQHVRDYAPFKKSSFRRKQGRNDFFVRCHYWPNCNRGEECFYIHPTVPCDKFPNCIYGAKCRFLHPICSVDGYCFDKSCPYIHTKIPGGSGETSLQNVEELLRDSPFSSAQFKNSLDASTGLDDEKFEAWVFANSAGSTMCKYLGECIDEKCELKHPPMCKYGTNCTDNACVYRHRKPDLKRFTWTKQPSE